MPDDFKYLETDFIVLWKFLTQGKEVSKTFGRIRNWLGAWKVIYKFPTLINYNCQTISATGTIRLRSESRRNNFPI